MYCRRIDMVVYKLAYIIGIWTPGRPSTSVERHRHSTDSLETARENISSRETDTSSALIDSFKLEFPCCSKRYIFSLIGTIHTFARHSLVLWPNKFICLRLQRGALRFSNNPDVFEYLEPTVLSALSLFQLDSSLLPLLLDTMYHSDDNSLPLLPPSPRRNKSSRMDLLRQGQWALTRSEVLPKR